MAGIVRITPRQLAAQWAAASNRFEANVFNFETMAGEGVVKVFKRSFDLKRFNSDNQQPWPKRKDRRRNPLLYDTGTLKDSIRVKKRHPKHKIVVHTDDTEFAGSATDPHRFGARHNKRREYGFVYAAIHNAGGITSGATGPASYIAKRQFMGHSTVIDDLLEYKLSLRIFSGFPR